MVDLNREEEYMAAAEADVKLVQHLVKDIDTYPEAVCYHCEQAVEKMLKQMWMDNGMMPRRTHDLTDLLGVACERGWLVATPDELACANFLNSYATKFKYIRMKESEHGEALEAVICCNTIANMLERNGYKSFLIETPAHFMYDEARDEAQG